MVAVDVGITTIYVQLKSNALLNIYDGNTYNDGSIITITLLQYETAQVWPVKYVSFIYINFSYI